MVSPPADGMAPDAGCQVPGSTRRPGPDGSSYHRGRGRHVAGRAPSSTAGAPYQRSRLFLEACGVRVWCGCGGSVWFELPEVWCALWRRAPKTGHSMPEEHGRPRQAWFPVGGIPVSSCNTERVKAASSCNHGHTSSRTSPCPCSNPLLNSGRARFQLRRRAPCRDRCLQQELLLVCSNIIAVCPPRCATR